MMFSQLHQCTADHHTRKEAGERAFLCVLFVTFCCCALQVKFGRPKQLDAGEAELSFLVRGRSGKVAGGGGARA